MPIIIPQQKLDKLKVSSEGNTVFFKGEIISLNPESALKPIFESIRKQMNKESIKEILFDISKLIFMNSSGISCFVDFILDLSPNEKLLIKTDLKKPYQERAINVFKSLNDKSVELIK